MAWISNWQYNAKIPVYPWHGGIATPRHMVLKTIGQKPTLIQQPHAKLETIESHTRPSFWKSFAEGKMNLDPVGKTLDIDLEFSPCGATGFGIIVQATSDGKQQTRIGYNVTGQNMFVDRTQSGDVSFDKTFARVYHAPLAPNSEGIVHLRVLVDWSSVEVFGGEGEATLTAQIFPNRDARFAQLFSHGGSTENVKLGIRKVPSIWH